MFQLSGKSVWIVQQRNAIINSSQQSLSVSLELRRVGVLTVHTMKQLTGLRMVVKQPV